jgi:nucleotide-binding universal stress UspA family protein
MTRSMRSILVPLDGSPLAERALPYAVGLARRSRARLHLVVVNEPRTIARGGPGAFALERHVDARLGEELRRYATDVERRVTSESGVETEATVLEGPPVPTLAGFLQVSAPDLLIVSSHGRTGGQARWLGSVTDALVRTSMSPVLVVPTREDAPVGSGAVTRVLVALDGTRAAESAVEKAIALLNAAGVEYRLMSAVRPLHPLVRTVAGDAEYERDLAEQRGILEAYLSALATGLRSRGVDARPEVRVDAHPAEAILASAVEHRVDLIVLATHARGPLGRILLGSVADKVLRSSPVPVLLCALVRDGGELMEDEEMPESA